METNKELIKFHSYLLEDYNPIHSNDKPVAQAFYSLTAGLCDHFRKEVEIQNGSALLCGYRIAYDNFLIPGFGVESHLSPGLIELKNAEGLLSKIKFPLAAKDIPEKTIGKTAKWNVNYNLVEKMRRIFDPEKIIPEFAFYHIMFPSFITPGSIALNSKNNFLKKEEDTVNVYASQEVYLSPDKISDHLEELKKREIKTLTFTPKKFKERRNLVQLGMSIENENEESLAYIQSSITKIEQKEFSKLIQKAYNN